MTEKTGKDPLPVFKEGGVVKESPNFHIVMGYKANILVVDRERFFIVPLNDQAEVMLQSAAGLHLIPTEYRPVAGREGDHLVVRMDWSEENWLDIVEEDNLLIPGEEYPDTVPTIQRMEELLELGKLGYTFPAKISGE
jgi:hypothetical protein